MSERLSANDVQLIYPSGQGASWFSLKNNGETKQVRFLYNTIDDVYFDVVHEVQVNGKTKTIQCLNPRANNPDGCPLCRRGYKQKVQLHVPVYDVKENKILVWTRSKTFLAQLQGLMARNNPLSGVVVEVMRIGAPRDPKTQYTCQPIAMNDGQTSERFGQLPDPSTYMSVMEYGELENYAASLDNISGSIPARSQNQFGYNYQQPQPAAYPQYGAPAQTPVQQPQYGNFAAPMQPQAPNQMPATQPMIPPQNMPSMPNVPPAPGAYQVPPAVPNQNFAQPVQQPQTPPQMPPQNFQGSVPVRRTDTTPANFGQPANANNDFVGIGDVDDDELPF